MFFTVIDIEYYSLLLLESNISSSSGEIKGCANHGPSSDPSFYFCPLFHFVYTSEKYVKPVSFNPQFVAKCVLWSAVFARRVLLAPRDRCKFQLQSDKINLSDYSQLSKERTPFYRQIKRKIAQICATNKST